MNHFFPYQRGIRKDQNRPSKIPKKKFGKNQELINKLNSKVKFRCNSMHPCKRIRFFYHDRNFKSCYFYNFELYHPKNSTNKRFYSEDHLPFISFINKHCENYANVLKSAENYQFNLETKGYHYKDYYSDNPGIGPTGSKRCYDRMLRNKYQQSNLSLRNCQSLTEIVSKVFILDLFII